MAAGQPQRPRRSRSQAFTSDTSITATGAVEIHATGTQIIDAVVFSIALGLAAGVGAGIGVAGAGVYAENRILGSVKAYVNGTRTGGSIDASTVAITATDSSQIDATAVAAAVAVAIGGDLGVAVAIGITIAFNEVDVDVAAHATDATIETATGGDITIIARTLGGQRFTITPSLDAGHLDDAAAAEDDDPNTTDNNAATTGDDEAVVDAAADAATLAALEAALKSAGQPLTSGKWSTDVTLEPRYTSGAGVKDLVRGDTVLHGGTVYVFAVATATPDNPMSVDLAAEIYTDPARWKTGRWVMVAPGDLVRVASSGLSYRLRDTTPDDVDDNTADLIDLDAETYTDVARWTYAPPDLDVVKPGETWQLVSGTDVLIIRKNGSSFEIGRPTIKTVAVAAALAFALGGGVGVAVAGAGAYARNDVLGSTAAYADGSVLDSGRHVTVEATAAAEISAVVVAAAVAVGVGLGAAGVGASIGIAISENRIGGRATNGDRQPFEVVAALVDTAVDAAGALSVTATSSETITAVVVAASVAVGAASTVGVGVAGAGSVATNAIIADVRALISGNGPTDAAITGISASGVTLSATDSSSILAVAIGASVAAGFAGTVGVSLAIAISLGFNEIDNRIEATITGVSDGVTARAGNVDLSAESRNAITAVAVAASVALAGGIVGASISGAGAAATNVILSRTRASVSTSVVTATGDGVDTGHVRIDASDRSSILAVIVAASAAIAGGFVAGGLSIGVSIARNFIGWKPGSGDSLTEQASQVHAFLSATNVDADGDVTVEAVSEATIDAIILAISVAIAGGAGAIALTGAGSSADNRISTDVRAYAAGGAVTAAVDAGIAGDHLQIVARDRSLIRSIVLAASIGVAAGVGIGVSISIAVALARNRVSVATSAYIENITIADDEVREIEIIASSGLDPPAISVPSLTPALLDGAIVPDTGVLDPVKVAALRTALNTAFPQLQLSDRLSVTRIVEGSEWTLRDLKSGLGYRVLRTPTGQFQIARTTIDALAIAASAAVGIGGIGGGAGSGAGALAVNTVLSRTNAFIAGSDVAADEDITIDASSTSSIVATIVSVSVAIGGGAFGGAALSIGVSIARNEIGFENGSAVPPTYKFSTGTPTIAANSTVEIDVGPMTGKVYEYLGTGEDANDAYDYQSSQTLPSDDELLQFERVLHNGAVYQYIGQRCDPASPDPCELPATPYVEIRNLGAQNYSDTTKWREITNALEFQDFTNGLKWREISTRRPVEVQAYVRNSSVDAGGRSRDHRHRPPVDRLGRRRRFGRRRRLRRRRRRGRRGRRQLGEPDRRQGRRLHRRQRYHGCQRRHGARRGHRHVVDQGRRRRRFAGRRHRASAPPESPSASPSPWPTTRSPTRSSPRSAARRPSPASSRRPVASRSRPPSRRRSRA